MQSVPESIYLSIYLLVVANSPRARDSRSAGHAARNMASAGSVLSGNAPARPQPAPAPSDPTPSVEDLTVDVEGKTAFALCRVVQNASEVFLYSNPNPDPGPNPNPP